VSTKTPKQPRSESQNEIRALLDRAQAGDKTILPKLRELLTIPANVDSCGGDLAKQAQFTLIVKFSGKNLLWKEALIRKLDLLRSELTGPNPTALEKLLVERIVACWLHLHHLEIIYANKEDMSLPLGTFYQSCLSAAQKRYLSAIKALAVIRKLALPALARFSASARPMTPDRVPERNGHEHNGTLAALMGDRKT
jgi:hypothetical protein